MTIAFFATVIFHIQKKQLIGNSDEFANRIKEKTEFPIFCSRTFQKEITTLIEYASCRENLGNFLSCM